MFRSVTAFGPRSLLDAAQGEGSATQGAFKDTHWDPGVDYPCPVMRSFICKGDSLATYCTCLLLLAHCIVLKMGTCGSAWMAMPVCGLARFQAVLWDEFTVGITENVKIDLLKANRRSTKSQRGTCGFVAGGQRKRPE